MTFFKHLRDAISGKIKHWNETNNVIVSELLNKSENLGSPHDLIFKQFNIAALLVVEKLIGFPDESVKIIDIDVKKISIHQFRQLYCVLLSYFAFIFYTSNPFLKEELKKALFTVTEEPKLIEKHLQSLDEIGKIDMMRIGGKVLDELVKIIGFGTRMDPGQLVAFTIFSAEIYKEAVKNIKAKLNF
jgi:hypothetical protein